MRQRRPARAANAIPQPPFGQRPRPYDPIRVISDDQVEAIHAAALKLLSEQGMRVLNARAIEEAGAKNGDICFGCHGGRAWYRTHFPYPRHAWQGMPAEIPDWAKGRPTASDVRFIADTMSKGSKP